MCQTAHHQAPHNMAPFEMMVRQGSAPAHEAIRQDAVGCTGVTVPLNVAAQVLALQDDETSFDQAVVRVVAELMTTLADDEAEMAGRVEERQIRYLKVQVDSGNEAGIKAQVYVELNLAKFQALVTRSVHRIAQHEPTVAACGWPLAAALFLGLELEQAARFLAGNNAMKPENLSSESFLLWLRNDMLLRHDDGAAHQAGGRNMDPADSDTVDVDVRADVIDADVLRLAQRLEEGGALPLAEGHALAVIPGPGIYSVAIDEDGNAYPERFTPPEHDEDDLRAVQQLKHHEILPLADGHAIVAVPGPGTYSVAVAEDGGAFAEPYEAPAAVTLGEDEVIVTRGKGYYMVNGVWRLFDLGKNFKMTPADALPLLATTDTVTTATGVPAVAQPEALEAFAGVYGTDMEPAVVALLKTLSAVDAATMRVSYTAARAAEASQSALVIKPLLPKSAPTLTTMHTTPALRFMRESLAIKGEIVVAGLLPILVAPPPLAARFYPCYSPSMAAKLSLELVTSLCNAAKLGLDNSMRAAVDASALWAQMLDMWGTFVMTDLRTTENNVHTLKPSNFTSVQLFLDEAKTRYSELFAVRQQFHGPIGDQARVVTFVNGIEMSISGCNESAHNAIRDTAEKARRSASVQDASAMLAKALSNYVATTGGGTRSYTSLFPTGRQDNNLKRTADAMGADDGPRRTGTAPRGGRNGRGRGAHAAQSHEDQQRHNAQPRPGLGADVCHRCHQPGHFRRDCPTRPGQGADDQQQQGAGGNVQNVRR